MRLIVNSCGERLPAKLWRAYVAWQWFNGLAHQTNHSLPYIPIAVTENVFGWVFVSIRSRVYDTQTGWGTKWRRLACNLM